MRRRVAAAALPQSAGAVVFRAISLTVLVLILLTWSSSADATESRNALGGEPSDNSGPIREATIDEGDESGTESVTMSIPLEKDGVINVEAPPMGVKIEKWDGEEVLLIVEKKRVKRGAQAATIDPVNIQVSRQGKNVRIATTGGSNWRESGMDLSFRIVLPESFEIGTKTCEKTDGAERLTGVLWRAVHREAIRWMTR